MRIRGKVFTFLLGLTATVAMTGTPVHAASARTTAGLQPQIAYFLVISQNSGKCLDLNGGSALDGTAIIQWGCHGGVNQQWRPMLRGRGFFEVSVAQTGKCLTVKDASQENGADIVETPCGGYQGNQLWYLLPFGPNYQTIRNVNSSKCLDVRDVSRDDGAAIQQWDCHGGPNQQWLLQE
jgi:hypothetical protein